MAEVTEMTSLSGAPPPINPTEPPKRKRGRPLGSTKIKTEAPDDAEDVPDVPEVTGNGDFWLMLQNFTDDEWNHLSAYVYRVAPKIDRKNNGRKANIQTYTSRFTPDDLMKDHGSGCYQIMLNHQDPGTGKYSRIAVEKVQILNPKYPPVVPDGDWVDDKENEMWKWGANTVPTAANGGGYPPGFNVADMMDKADQRALKMVEIMTPQKDDTVLTTLLTKLLDKSLTPPPAPDNSAIERIFKMQDDTLKELRAELREMRNRESVPQKSIIEQFIEIRPQIKDLVDAFATKAGKTDIWADIAKEGIGQLPELIALGRDMVNKKAPEPQPSGVGTHQAAAAIAAVTPAAASPVEPPAKPIADMTEEEKRAYVDHLWKKWGGNLLQISTRLVEEFTIQDNGYSFRDWYVEMYGKLRWADLKRDVDPELMANMYLAHPQLQKALSPPVRLVVFLREFVTDFGAEDDTPLNDKLAAVGKAGGVESGVLVPAATPDEAKA